MHYLTHGLTVPLASREASSRDQKKEKIIHYALMHCMTQNVQNVVVFLRQHLLLSSLRYCESNFLLLSFTLYHQNQCNTPKYHYHVLIKIKQEICDHSNWMHKYTSSSLIINLLFMQYFNICPSFP